MPHDPLIGHLIYGLAWASFGIGHSWLANVGVRSRLDRWFHGRSRLAYNVIAVLHLLLVALVGHAAIGRSDDSWAVPVALQVLQWAMLAVALALFWTGSRQYDMASFLGTAKPATGDLEPLRTDGVHRYVRHPFYAGAYLLLLGLVRDPFSAATAFWASLYLIAGTAIEEHRLHRLYGEAYRAYCARVPSLGGRFTRLFGKT